MVNRPESTWCTLLAGARTALPSLRMANSTHGAEETTVAWVTVSCWMLSELNDSVTFVGCITEKVFSSGCPGSSEDQTTPMLVTALKGLKVVDVACGSGDAQTLAVTENGKKKNHSCKTVASELKCFYPASLCHRSGLVLGGWRLRQTGPGGQRRMQDTQTCREVAGPGHCEGVLRQPVFSSPHQRWTSVHVGERRQPAPRSWHRRARSLPKAARQSTG